VMACARYNAHTHTHIHIYSHSHTHTHTAQDHRPRSWPCPVPAAVGTVGGDAHPDHHHCPPQPFNRITTNTSQTTITIPPKERLTTVSPQIPPQTLIQRPPPGGPSTYAAGSCAHSCPSSYQATLIQRPPPRAPSAYAAGTQLPKQLSGNPHTAPPSSRRS
jgi:hypothetical protein